MSRSLHSYPLWQSFLNVIERNRKQKRIGIMPMVIAGYPDPMTSTRYVEMLVETGCELAEVVHPIVHGWSPSTNSFIRNAHLLASRHALPEDSLRIASQFDGSLKIIYPGSVSTTLLEAGKACVGHFSIVQLAMPTDCVPRDELESFPVPLTTMVSAEDPPDRLAAVARTAESMLVCKVAPATGGEQFSPLQVARALDVLREATDLPIFCTFGISRAEDIAALRDRCDGVIVGTELLKRFSPDLESVRELMRSFQEAAYRP